MAFPGSNTSTPRNEFVCADNIARWLARVAARCAAMISCFDGCLGLPSSAGDIWVSELALETDADSRCRWRKASSSNGAEIR